MQNDSQNNRRPPENGKRAFEPRPMKIDAKKFGPWIVERDRKVLDMLEEYDRRQERRRTQGR